MDVDVENVLKLIFPDGVPGECFHVSILRLYPILTFEFFQRVLIVLRCQAGFLIFIWYLQGRSPKVLCTTTKHLWSTRPEGY